jgi:hypothetical protein
MASWYPVLAVDLPVHFEIDARIVVQAGGNGLGSMAKASIPVRVARRSSGWQKDFDGHRPWPSPQLMRWSMICPSTRTLFSRPGGSNIPP